MSTSTTSPLTEPRRPQRRVDRGSTRMLRKGNLRQLRNWLSRYLPSTKQAIIGTLAILAISAGAYAWPRSQNASGDPALVVSSKLVPHTVQRGDLPVTVTERGTLASQQETRVACELETVPGQSGTRILWLVSNGTEVKKGDLLVEFDAAPLRERLNTQLVTFQQVNAAKIQANSRFENQKTNNETNLASAQLRVEMSELAFKMYEDGKGGSYKITLADLNAKIQEAKNQISESQAGLRMKAARRQGIETLFKLGYRGKGDLDQAVHEHLQADFALAKAANSLSTAEANRKKLQQYEYPMKLLELKGAIATAKRALEQVGRDNEALLAQAEATKNAAEQSLKTETERLEKFKTQLEKCKLYAPHDGLVAHSPDRTPWGRLVAEGELVTERFKILSLPDLAKMQVKVAVHESVLDQTKTGLVASVRIDAAPDTSYQGTVRSVAVLPTQDSGMSSDVKVYDTIVTVDDDVEHLKPGMTAIVDIHIQRLEDVISLPVTAIVQEEESTWCYVMSNNRLQRRDLKLGISNDSHVEVVEGLAVEEVVVLNPSAINLPASSQEETQKEPSSPLHISAHSPRAVVAE
jgi:HlyD family secretion protein